MVKKTILALSVLLLFSLCIFKTYDMLSISNSEEIAEETDIVEETDERVIINNSNPNMYQDEDIGMRMSDGNFIYYNAQNYLMKYDVYAGKEQPLAAGIFVKCLTDAENDIYGVTTMMSGTGIDSDYLIKISKDTGNTTIFYKTECPHITSVVFDGMYAYYTDESHIIYQVNGTDKTEWVSGNKSADYPVIIGIYDGCMFITDGTQIESIDIKTKTKKTVYSQLCSAYQKPIMNDDAIYLFENFKRNSIIRFDIKTGKSEQAFSSDFVDDTARADKIDSFAVSGNNLFFNCEGRLYAVRNGEKPKFCQYISSLESSSFNGYLFYLTDGKINVLDAFKQ